MTNQEIIEKLESLPRKSEDAIPGSRIIFQADEDLEVDAEMEGRIGTILAIDQGIFLVRFDEVLPANVGFEHNDDEWEFPKHHWINKWNFKVLER